MDQEIIVEAIGKHLDAIETYVNAISILAIAATWAGIQRSSEIEVLGMKFKRRHAFWVAAGLYLIANMTILILFLRIGDLVALLDASHAVKGATLLATHSWVLNPFSYFGNTSIARAHSGEGYGLLIVTWWLCNASLSTLVDDKRNHAAALLLALFLVIGLGAMLAMSRVDMIVVDGLRTAAPALYSVVVDTATERYVGTVLGIVVGALVFVVANKLQQRFRETR